MLIAAGQMTEDGEPIPLEQVLLIYPDLYPNIARTDSRSYVSAPISLEQTAGRARQYSSTRKASGRARNPDSSRADDRGRRAHQQAQLCGTDTAYGATRTGAPTGATPPLSHACQRRRAPETAGTNAYCTALRPSYTMSGTHIREAGNSVCTRRANEMVYGGAHGWSFCTRWSVMVERLYQEEEYERKQREDALKAEATAREEV
eukprot:1252412-Rhodomonas_salina.6